MLIFDQPKLESLINSGEYDRAEEILKAVIRQNPREHWFYTKLSSVLYAQRKYADALSYSEKAYKIAPKDALVLWDYACVLEVLDHTSAAIKVWGKLLNLGMENIAYGQYGEGIRWAKSIINDTCYRLSLAYSDIGEYSKSLQCAEKALSGRQRGVPSLYKISDIKKILAQQYDSNAFKK